MTTIEGGCLCGAVNYRAEVESTAAMSCHCRDCQKATGCGCATFVSVPVNAMELEGEPSSYSKKSEAGRDVTRFFCGQCGSQLYSEVEAAPGMRFVKVGSLDQIDACAPQMHIWTRSRAKWDEIPEGRGVFERNPGG